MKKVLLVDDDSRMLRLLKSYLDEKYEVFPIKGGTEAIYFLQKTIPDLIILDYMMPALDGPHTLQSIREIDGCKDIPVLFLTGVTEKDRVEACMSQNPEGYMVKPVAKEELLMKLAQIFEVC